jgi:hypothetical protein
MGMVVAGAAAQVANAAAQAAGGNFAGAALSIAQQQADAAALALKEMRKIDPGAPPDFGTFLTGEYTVLVGGIPMPPAMDLATIMGKLRGLGRSVMNRLSRNGDDGAPGRTGHPDDDPGQAGCGNCPRG